MSQSRFDLSQIRGFINLDKTLAKDLMLMFVDESYNGLDCAIERWSGADPSFNGELKTVTFSVGAGANYKKIKEISFTYFSGTNNIQTEITKLYDDGLMVKTITKTYKIYDSDGLPTGYNISF